jgi:hypothetical protein
MRQRKPAAKEAGGKGGRMNLEQHLKKEQVIHLDLHNFTSVERGTSARATIEKMRHE